MNEKIARLNSRISAHRAMGSYDLSLDEFLEQSLG